MASEKIPVRFWRSYGIYKAGEVAGFRYSTAMALTQGVHEDRLGDIDPKVWPVAVLCKGAKPSDKDE